MKKKDPAGIRRMFDTIAPRYDFLNRFLSMRQDVYWRRKLVAAVPTDSHRLLDIACGTGDVAIEAMRQSKTRRLIVGMDFSFAMLQNGQKKLAGTEAGRNIHLVAADAFAPPFAENSFDAATIAFGIRNIEDKPAALETFRRHLRPGGGLAVLELTTPAKGILKTIYMAYFQHILPLVGWFFSKDRSAYQYLPASVIEFPPSAEFAAMMRDAGFTDVTFQRLTFGIATLYTGRK
ncbi:MAG: bifunctional demethylmenaquinone methyltransferase/2-methoxy-6-polyprenyl-1,4-benzoquinol methylase UbiE [Thermodesulfobacteriota bacterium]|nr:bifunctional demethylmenaquinone methyltransferase/2-methoxy-6-polyprenyl-1,4-benzoquinol methylase UbiE [Thermodesulfobacteriota bacterium]